MNHDDDEDEVVVVVECRVVCCDDSDGKDDDKEKEEDVGRCATKTPPNGRRKKGTKPWIDDVPHKNTATAVAVDTSSVMVFRVVVFVRLLEVIPPVRCRRP